MTQVLIDHKHLFNLPGAWTTIYVDGSTGTVDSLRSDDVLPQNVSDSMDAAGAPKADSAAAAAALSRSARGLPDPVARFLLIHEGEAVVDEFLPGGMVMTPVVAVAPVPDLSPLVRHCPEDFAYVIAEVGHGGGEIYLRYADGDVTKPRVGEQSQIEGDREHSRKVHGGGWSHRRFQQHAEKVWKMNAGEVAGEIDRVATQHRAHLVIVAGDIRARQLVADQVSDETRRKLSIIDSNTRAAGADEKAFALQVQELVVRVMAERQRSLLETLAAHEGQATRTTAVGTGPVVTALQQGQVDTLLLETPSLDGQTVLALDSAPWIALSGADTAGAGVVGKVPALAGMLRAVALTDAKVTLYPSGALDSRSIAALLRWPTGPDLPAAV
ncbi:Vms1/Ankzf1 family peptidyl-tRNA hydrolase [Arthrobacter sp. Br18]|uniref:baeRF2 domain-containing protein n=1 Tax=Arthrobacter sp. Br18 TaxID=1312954 RepID=UPI00047BEFD8|nr:Vms1/Ankzf1 family peptidyl-tRNA hydrolase [Arthrobacter sp. Br18]